MSIFVSIASFCDPVLPFTIKEIVEKANKPDQLHLCVIDQSFETDTQTKLEIGPAKLSYCHIDPVQSQGCCWARSIAMSFFTGEDWFFQIDSHMDFDQDWDKTLIEHTNRLMRGRKGIAISAYPNPFVFENGLPVKKFVCTTVLTQVVKPNSVFKNDCSQLSFEAHPFNTPYPVNGFQVAGGCLFAPGEIVNKIPYDPFLYFHGEEQSMSVRIFTQGWDIFHIPQLPVYHLYNNANGVSRPLHWDHSIDVKRTRKWFDKDKSSLYRLDCLLRRGHDLGAYGLGRERTIAEYSQFSGIDYINKTLSAKAFAGPWRS